MRLRRILTLSLPSSFIAIISLGAYLAVTWPYRRPHYDGKEPVSLSVAGMPGLRMYLDPKDTIITQTIFSTGSWEDEETDWFIRTVKPGDVVVDAGANVGYYTIIASRLVGDAGKVYAFEPDPRNFEILRRNVRLNRLTNVVLEQKALSNRKGTIKLYIANGNKGDHRIYQPEGESRPSVDVEAVRLDEYFKDRERPINVLKSDTQGAEGVIIEGMSGLLDDRTDGPTIFLEFWPHAMKAIGTEPSDFLNLLRSHEYRLYEFDPKARNGLRGVKPEDLLTTYYRPQESQPQTNLMALRGGRALPDGLGRIRRPARIPGEASPVASASDRRRPLTARMKDRATVPSGS